MKARPELLALAPGVLTTVLFAARACWTGHEGYGFLLFNLTLAAIPAVLALLAENAHQTGSPRTAVVLLVLWLAFLPNAPYIVTDFIHLRTRPPIPMWFDVALLGSAALGGLALGAASLARVHDLLRETLGPRAALGAVGLACLACGYGIYLGRFARLNSWDLVLDPFAVLADAAPPLFHPLAYWRVWGITLVFGALTAASFVAQARLRVAPHR